MSDYSEEDIERTTWNEYGETLEDLREKVESYIRENNIEIDVVVPILRAGNFPGTYLAYKLDILRIIPVQYKYFFDEETDDISLNKLLPLNTDPLDKEATILLVEGDHCFGTTANLAAREIKDKIPESTIIYAADRMDYSYRINKYADAVFYGKATNETRELDEEECKEKGILTGTHLFPWENYEEEWKTLQAEQYEYQDTEKAEKTSENKKKIDFSKSYTDQLDHLVD
jgi:hypoxanthine phosphoribosyltransferase